MVALMAIDWTRDEIVLACALVRDHGWQGVRADQQEVRDLSALLQQAPLHAVEIRDAAFRSPNSVQRTWPTPLVTKAVLVGDCAGRPSLRSATSPRAPAEAHTDWSYLTSYPNTGHDRHLVRRPPGVGSGAVQHHSTPGGLIRASRSGCVVHHPKLYAAASRCNCGA